MFLYLLILLVAHVAQGQILSVPADLEDLDYGLVMLRLAQRLPEVLEELVQMDEEHNSWVEALKGDMVEEQKLYGTLEDALNEDCRLCRVIVGTFRAWVKRGNDYDDIKNFTMHLCYEFVPPMDPDLLCEPTLDRYLPHVVKILNETDKYAIEICTQYNNCYEEELNRTLMNAYRKSHDNAPFPAKHSRAPPKRVTDTTNRKLEDAIRVLHLSDIHVDPHYAEGAAIECNMPTCCRAEYPGEGEAYKWGSYPCNIPYKTVENFFEFLSQLQPDLIFITGDTPPHFLWQETLDSQLNISERLAQSISEYFPGVPAFTTIGNHEMTPTNMYYVPRPEIQILHTKMYEFWEDLSGLGEEQWKTMQAAGYYSILVKPGLRVMSYNTNYGATDNFYNVLNDEVAPEYLEMRRFFENEFEAARQNGERVIILGHHTTGSGSSIDYEGYYITDLLARYGDIIIFYLLGHNHGDEYRLVNDLDTGEPRVVAISGPTLGTRNGRNPSAKMYYLSADDFIALDGDTYFVNITGNGNEEELIIEHSYRYSEEYGMPDLTVESFYHLAQRFITEPDILWRYLYNSETRSKTPGPCEGSCVQQQYCKVMSNVYQLTRRCRNAPWPPA